MKNLGKIILGLFLIQSSMYASVVASVDFTKVTVGETVTYSIKSTNANMDRPILNTLCSTNVVATSSQTNIEMLNGDYSRTKIFNYQFMPRKTCTIKPISILVDGKNEQTNAIKVEVLAPTQNLDADFVLDLVTKKQDVFVGEPFLVEMLVKQKHSARAIDSKFIAPKMEGFWVSGEPKQEKYDDGIFMITKIIYRVSAQHSGSLHITPAQLAVAKRSNTRDRWGSFMQDVKWKSYFSNEVKIDVKPIPQGAKYIGDLKINATVDTTEVNPNEAVNVTIEVKGNGNLEDIESFKPYIQDVSLFDEKPLVKGELFREKIALVGDRDFVIPAFSLKFYNLRTKKLETIATQEIQIKVNAPKQKEALTIKRDESQTLDSNKSTVVIGEKKLSILQVVFIFILGVGVGVFMMFMKPWEQFKREKSFDIKDEKKLLIKLMPFREDENVQKIVDMLEHNMYEKEKKPIEKQLLKEVLKKYDIH